MRGLELHMLFVKRLKLFHLLFDFIGFVCKGQLQFLIFHLQFFGLLHSLLNFRVDDLFCLCFTVQSIYDLLLRLVVLSAKYSIFRLLLPDFGDCW